MQHTMSRFDEIVERRGSGSYKWDSSADQEVIPLWVADMDFRTAPVVEEALQRRVSHGIFGYTLVDHTYYDALTRWFATRHGYEFKAENVIYTSGVVPAISAIIKALTKPGDEVAVMTPVYNCFFSSIRNNGCKIADSPLRRVELPDGRFTYRIDFDDLERVLSRPQVTMLLLCNPHNPAGRTWTHDELSEIARLCHIHHVRVVSDEIHCELTAPGTSYTPYGPIDPDAVVCLSPSKAFNTAGLQIANIVCPDAEVRAAVDRAININEVCDVNPFGVEALKAAYTPQGEAWLNELREYLWENYRLTAELLHTHLPQCPVTLLEATYLPWVDVRALGIPSEELEEKLRDRAKVWVNCGDMYGTSGYIRLNIACPRSILAEGLRRLIEGIRQLTAH
jgi:putative aminotransferase